MTKKVKACEVIHVPTNEAEARAARRAIAKDALKWIELGALVPTSNVYFRPSNFGVRGEAQARDVNFGRSSVCALGAIMVAKAVRYDDCTADLLQSQAAREWHGNLRPFFDEDQLKAIEYSFEGWDEYYGPMGDRVYKFNGPKFTGQYTDMAVRLTRILKNIVKHGEFRP